MTKDISWLRYKSMIALLISMEVIYIVCFLFELLIFVSFKLKKLCEIHSNFLTSCLMCCKLFLLSLILISWSYIMNFWNEYNMN